MSPLACSLLALAALFAVSNAKNVHIPNPFCDERMRGIEGDSSEHFKMTVSGGVVNIPDNCTRLGRKLVGEDVSVCNAPYSKPLLRSVFGLSNKFGILGIDCPTNTNGCMTLELDVTQHCKMDVPLVRG
ncbi:uncharacterized protein LOC133518396 [Cydia pomonella]|uniref:uncharacterized protein LOC133518396 n=1 Tax=Cydia pomonella TaxID=82600 RepID=UPI002ADE540C|nr:uncharacterized protein LOC133518396 [Cydia pomonella]